MMPDDFNEYRRINDNKVDRLSTELATHTAQGEMRDKIMLEKVEAITEKVTMLLAMWEQARGVVTFVKAMAAITVVIAATYTWVASHFSFK